MKSPGEDHPVEAVPSPCDIITGKIIVSTSAHLTDLWPETFSTPCLPGPGLLSGKRTIKLIKEYVLCSQQNNSVCRCKCIFHDEGREGATTNKQTNQEADELQRVQTCDIKLAAPGPG